MSYPRQISVPFVETDQANRSNLFVALDQNNIQLCREILENEGTCNEKGWNDMRPLHQCCLRGQIDAITLLVQCKADLNALTSYGETPLHYACRRGDIEIIHFLIKSGSDVSAVDKSGRNCMHFAATGGSVLALHYLGTQTSLTYDAATFNGDSPLHICCNMQHANATFYLLRHERSNLRHQNELGETVLHVAAKLANEELVWSLLCHAGCGLIHVKNNKGETAIDIAMKESSKRHQIIAVNLKNCSKQNPKSPPKGPLVTWYTLLMLPFISLGLVFIFSTYLNGNSGYFCSLMTILLLIYVGRQSHRVSHPSKWPNPMYVGMFIAATNHCTIATFLKILPNVSPSLFLIASLTVLTVVVYRNFYELINGNPGIISQSKSINGRPLNVLDIALKRCKPQDFCPYTELIKPENGKYCRICEHEVLDLDHHCLFLYNCIAKLNHRRFVLFIMFIMFMQILFCLEVWLYLGSVYHSISFEILFHREPWLYGCVLLCVSAFVWETTLVLSQLANIALNQTTYYSHRRLNQIGKKEAIVNIFNFFASRKSANRNLFFHDKKSIV